MAVGFLTSSTPFSALGGFGSNQTASLDSGATGGDRLLAVAVFYENGSDPAISGITYNGVGLTKQIEETVSPADGFSETVEIWTLVAPATGANTLALTNSATSQDAAIQAAVYTGVNQTTPIGGTNSVARQLSDDGTFSLTISADGGAFWGVVKDRGGDSVLEAATDNTRREHLRLDDSASGLTAAIGDRLTGSGAVTVGATQTAIGGGVEQQDIAGAGIALEPASAGTVAVGLATETDAAHAVSGAKTATVGQAAETDAAHAVVASKATAIQVGLATETDTAHAVASPRTVQVGLATETDTAHAVTVLADITVEVGRAGERDVAHALSSGLPPFWWRFGGKFTAGRIPAPRKLEPIIFTDRSTGDTYVIQMGDGKLMELVSHTPAQDDFVYPAGGEPTLHTAGKTYKVYVEGGQLLYERYGHEVFTRPILFGDVPKPKARDNRYELYLPEKVVK